MHKKWLSVTIVSACLLTGTDTSLLSSSLISDVKSGAAAAAPLMTQCAPVTGKVVPNDKQNPGGGILLAEMNECMMRTTCAQRMQRMYSRGTNIQLR